MALAFLILSVLCPPLGLFLGAIGLTRDFKNWRKYILCLTLFMAAIAYAYTPIGSSDLTRYRSLFEEFGQKSFWEAVTYSGVTVRGRGSNLVTAYAFYWLMGRIGDYHLASAITTGIIYYIAYYITCDIGIRLNSSKRHIYYYLVFITLALNFTAIANNIRNIFAFALVGLAIYRDCLLKKRNIWTLAIYLFAVFFHTSAILFIFLRLIIEVQGKAKWIISALLVSSSSIIGLLYRNLYRIRSNNVIVAMIKFAIRKGYGFFNDTDSHWGLIVQRSGSQRLARIVYILIAFIICVSAVIVILKTRKEDTPDTYYDKNYSKFFMFVTDNGFLTISCISMLTPEYWRFASALIVFGAAIYLFVQKKVTGKIQKAFLNLIFIPMPVGTLLWVRELINSSVTLDLVYKPFISSPIIVVVMDVFDLIFG